MRHISALQVQGGSLSHTQVHILVHAPNSHTDTHTKSILQNCLTTWRDTGCWWSKRESLGNKIIRTQGKDRSIILWKENQISMTLISHLSDTVTNTWDHQLIKKQGLFPFSLWKLLSMANVSCYLGPRVRVHGRARPISSWRGSEREEEESRVPQSPSSVHPPWQKYFLLGHTL